MKRLTIVSGDGHAAPRSEFRREAVDRRQAQQQVHDEQGPQTLEVAFFVPVQAMGQARGLAPAKGKGGKV